MTARALVAHLVFAALALAFAWRQAHTAKDRGVGASSVVLLDARAGDVAKVGYSWPQGSTSVATEGSGPARSVVVELDRLREDPSASKKDSKPEASKESAAGAAASGADAGPTPNDPASTDGPPEAIVAPPTREQARFPGGRSVVAALEALEPLKTRRTLGFVDAARLKAMGLDAPERSLTITTTGGASLVLDVGEQAYGGQGRYVRVRGDSAVHLIDTAVVTGLEGSLDTLLEKRLVTLDIEDVVTLKASAGGKTRAFMHADREQPQKRRFVSQDDPSAASDAAGKVMTSLRNVRGTKLLGEADLAGASAAAVVQIDVAERPSMTVELIERSGGGYAARSGAWVWQVSETQARELLEDVTGVLD